MKNSNKININIEKEDNNLNDYLYVWSELNCRPNKSTFHGFFQPDKFLNFLDGLNFNQISFFSDFIQNEETPIINQKIFGTIEENIFLSFTHLDKNHEDSMISDVYLIYEAQKNIRVEEILQELSEISMKEEEEIEVESKEKLFILGLSQNGFELDYLTNKKDFEDIEYFYQEDVLKKVKKTIKKINKEKKGLTIISGERGVGKTNLLSFISTKVEKKCLYIPSNLIESSISSPEFKNILKQNLTNSILIIDDAELYLSQIYSKSNLLINNLLQLVDGIQSDSLNLNIVLSLNCEVTEIDKTIIESNNIVEIIEVGKLSEIKVEELTEYLGKKNKIKSSSNLREVLRGKPENNKSELGFK